MGGECNEKSNFDYIIIDVPSFAMCLFDRKNKYDKNSRYRVYSNGGKKYTRRTME